MMGAGYSDEDEARSDLPCVARVGDEDQIAARAAGIDVVVASDEPAAGHLGPEEARIGDKILPTWWGKERRLRLDLLENERQLHAVRVPRGSSGVHLKRADAGLPREPRSFQSRHRRVGRGFAQLPVKWARNPPCPVGP